MRSPSILTNALLFFKNYYCYNRLKILFPFLFSYFTITIHVTFSAVSWLNIFHTLNDHLYMFSYYWMLKTSTYFSTYLTFQNIILLGAPSYLVFRSLLLTFANMPSYHCLLIFHRYLLIKKI